MEAGRSLGELVGAQRRTKSLLELLKELAEATRCTQFLQELAGPCRSPQELTGACRSLQELGRASRSQQELK